MGERLDMWGTYGIHKGYTCTAVAYLLDLAQYIQTGQQLPRPSALMCTEDLGLGFRVQGLGFRANLRYLGRSLQTLDWLANPRVKVCF